MRIIIDAMSKLELKSVIQRYGRQTIVNGVDFRLEQGSIACLLGPSGCGKTTLLRCIAGFEEISGGEILIHDAVVSRAGHRVPPEKRQVGMVFQRPNPFPTMSIRENVLAGVKLNNRRISKGDAEELVESSLRGANLWNEVKDRLDRPGSGLSGGQQQRLCIARAIAVSPQVLLMDEPCSALDPISTYAIEELIGELKKNYTIVIVTHNMQQASRVSDKTAFFNIAGTGKPGKLIEYNDTATIFTQPAVQATEDYVSGRFG